MLSLTQAYPIHPITPSIISTILWITGTCVLFNSTWGSPSRWTGLVGRGANTHLGLQTALATDQLNGWIGGWIGSVEWPDRELKTTDQLNGWIERLNCQCQRGWICHIWKLNFQHGRSERVGGWIGHSDHTLDQIRQVELNGTWVPAIQSIVLRWFVLVEIKLGGFISVFVLWECLIVLLSEVLLAKNQIRGVFLGDLYQWKSNWEDLFEIRSGMLHDFIKYCFWMVLCW